MAGGIVPRYDVPQGVPLSPKYAVPPVDNTIPAIMAEVSKAGLAIAGSFSDLAASKARVADTTEMAKRTMMVEIDLDQLQSDIRDNRTLHKDAVSHYNEALKGLSEKWTKDLRPDLTAVLNERAARKAITGRKVVQGIQDKFLVDDFTSTADNFERTKIDRAGRLDLTDEEVFSGVAPGRVPIYVTEQPSSVAVRSDYRQGLDEAIASRAITADKAGDREWNLLDAMSYRRLQRMAISDSPAQVQQALDLLDADEKEPGTNFARYLKVEHKNTLRRAAQEQRDKIQAREISDENRAYELGQRQKKERADEDKKQDHVEIGELVIGVMRGTKGTEDFDKLRITNPTLQEDVNRQENIQRLIDTRGREGGTTNWALYNQIRAKVVRSRGAANITDELLNVTAVPGGIARDDADRLMTWATQQSERSVYKDDFFQRGQADITRVLQPEIGLVDIGNAKSRRFGEASREFEDRAKLLIERGEREKIPALAREITDRYVKQAPKVSVDVRDIPRHPDPQTLTNAFVRDYGPDRAKWPPAASAEYDRQSRILKDATPPPPVQETPPGPKPGSSKPKQQQPNPIKK